jgi:hypothetical protein
MNLDVDDMWSYVGMIVVLTGLAVGVMALTFPKKVDGYYLSQGGGGTVKQATCVWAHWTWHPDETSFCTNNYQEALDFMNKANASLGK